MPAVKKFAIGSSVLPQFVGSALSAYGPSLNQVQLPSFMVNPLKFVPTSLRRIGRLLGFRPSGPRRPLGDLAPFLGGKYCGSSFAPFFCTQL